MIIASQNKGKIAEFRDLLAPLHIVAAPANIMFPPEDRESYAAHAIGKALAVSHQTGQAALGDDSGLEVYSLGLKPGTHSARYGGEGLTDKERVQHLLSELGDCTNRNAEFICVIAYHSGFGQPAVFSGKIAGVIGYEPRGNNGFGYDSIFHPLGDSFMRSFAEMKNAEKHVLSHRARACYALKNYLI